MWGREGALDRCTTCRGTCGGHVKVASEGKVHLIAAPPAEGSNSPSNTPPALSCTPPAPIASACGQATLDISPSPGISLSISVSPSAHQRTSIAPARGQQPLAAGASKAASHHQACGALNSNVHLVLRLAALTSIWPRLGARHAASRSRPPWPLLPSASCPPTLLAAHPIPGGTRPADFPIQSTTCGGTSAAAARLSQA